MPLIQFNADFGRVASSLERIATALEWLLACQVDERARTHVARSLPLPATETLRSRPSPKGPRVVVSAPTDEQLWEAEQGELRRSAREAEEGGAP